MDSTPLLSGGGGEREQARCSPQQDEAIKRCKELQRALKAWKPKTSWKEKGKRSLKRATVKVKRITSYGKALYLKSLLLATLFAADPVLKLIAAYGFLSTGNPWWASCVLVTFFTPPVLMYVIANAVFVPDQREVRRKQFIKAANGPPTLVRVLLTHFRMMAWLWMDAVRGACTMNQQQQAYCRLQTTLAITEQTLFTLLQIYVMIRESYLHFEKPLITPEKAGPATASAMWNLYQALGYFQTNARICTGGNVSDFRVVLFSLGAGAAPPMMLQRLLTQRRVKCTDDLSDLDQPGLASIFRCLMESDTLEEVCFEGTGIDGWYRKWAEDFPGACDTGFSNSFNMLAHNRSLLRRVEFQPEVQLDTKQVSKLIFQDAVQLESVTNGREELYNRSTAHPRTPLRDAIDGNDALRCAELLACREARRAATAMDYWLAVRLDHWEVLAAMINASPFFVLLEGHRLLTMAAYEGANACFQLLLFCGVDIEASRDDGRTPLLLAAAGGNAAGVAALLEARADVGASTKDGHGVLYLLAQSGCAEAVAPAVAAGAEVNVPTLQCGWTPLHNSAICNTAAVARALVAANADLNSVASKVGATPLHVAAAKGSAEVVRVLLSGQADPNVRGTGGVYKDRIALDIAEVTENHLCAKILSEAASAA